MPVPDFSPGEVLTASAMDSIGLWLIKTHTLPTSTNTTTISDVFSSTYEAYKIIATDGRGTAIGNVEIRLGATNTGYTHNRVYNTPTVVAPAGNAFNNTTGWFYAGQGSTNMLNLNVDIFNPWLSRWTFYSGSYLLEDGANSQIGTTSGYLANTTSYTAFTLNYGGGNFNGGTVRVYGYRK